jgi:16S rRNA (guanine1207-N2)-methyltransferase
MTEQEPSQHYFSAQPQARSREQRIAVEVRGISFGLWTDKGMFSPDHVDRGSLNLAKEVQLRPGMRVLDWGAGYGFLGCLLARLYPDCPVVMAEINERAAALAERNARELGLAQVRVIVGPAPASLGDERFDCLVSNPPLRAGRAAVEEVIDDAVTRLNPGGELWLVIPTNKGAKRYLAYLQERFAEARTVSINGGFRVLWARKAA